MGNSGKIREDIRELQAGGVRFSRLVTVCTKWFGQPRITGSHHVFKMPWKGRPTINLQKAPGGKAKSYQVGQVVTTLEKLAKLRDDDE